MNPRDLPEVVAELIIEMHEVRSEIKEVRAEMRGLNNQADKLERTMEQGFTSLGQRFEAAIEQQSDKLVLALSRTLGQHLDYLAKHDTQLKDHETRLGNLESPQ